MKAFSMTEVGKCCLPYLKNTKRKVKFGSAQLMSCFLYVQNGLTFLGK